ncbi:MAG TPA: mandelate racemase/muconate lactonizing enzyme family protein [Bryobacteraceae bacterium]|jgi:L-alanine-DL-glutamate epimerase-like enolase superfamily enzyme|nr:mandelate racemase/muconate lactonizing enzyme family protein [Bryobacteraceae bacterium]
MKIERADIYVVKLDRHYRVGGHAGAPNRLPGSDYYFEPQWAQAYSRITESCLVKLTTSNGLTGWGEAQAPLAPETPASILARLLAPAALGQPALATEVMYDRLYEMMLVRGHNASFYLDAVAAVDIALWDIKGKAWQVPICHALGGPYRERLPAYLSGLRKPTRDERVDLARSVVARGFRGAKVFFGSGVGDLCQELAAIRDALGHGAFFALDSIHAHSVDEALRIGRVLDQLHADWYEAPIKFEDLEGHRLLSSRIDTPVAGGENLRSVAQFLPWIESGALRVAQPDVGRCGITAARRIAGLAHAFHRPTALHIGVCTGIAMAATWQLAAALPSFLIQEHQFDLFETANSLLRTPLRESGGLLDVPLAPGLGVDVDEQAVAAHATGHWVVTPEGVNRT